MILVDADVLLALVNRSDARHRLCVEVLRSLSGPLATSWPVLTAALGCAGTWAEAGGVILEMVSRGALRVLPLGAEDAPRLGDLVAKGAKPLSLAHASLVRLVEREAVDSVFTLSGADLAGRSATGRERRLRILPARKRRTHARQRSRRRP
jgi:predicted nucleic acid-binding protein